MGLLRIAAAWVACSFLLAGCGGGGGGGTASTPDSAPSAAGVITGVAATGAPLAGATIRLVDSKGTLVATATAGADGSYTLDVPASAVVPLVASATKDDVVLFSPVAAGGTQRVNITPLTNVAAAQLSPTGDPSALGSQVQAGNVTFNADKVRQVVAALLQALQPLLTNVGSAGVDPISGTFAADGTGHDRVLASLNVVVSPGAAGAGTIAITVKGVGAAGEQPPSITFTAGSTPPKLPETAASAQLPPTNTDALIADWLSRAQACFALPRTDRVTGTTLSDTVKAAACRGLFWNDDPATYRHGGAVVNAQSAFSSLYSDGTTGEKLDLGRLEFVDADGSLLVSWRETTATGAMNPWYAVFRVQNGSLKAYGNQGTYNFYVRATATSREFIAQPALSYVATGYGIVVSNANDGTSSLLDRVVVTAPGGRRLTLRPLPGMSFLGLERPADNVLTATSALRLAGSFQSSATAGKPRGLVGDTPVWATNPAGEDKDWTDAEVAALPEVGRWKGEFFLAGNTGSTPDSVQYAVVTSRPVLPSRLATQKWATLTPAYRDSFAAMGAGGAIAMTDGSAFTVNAGGSGWQVPDGGPVGTQTIQVFGYADITGKPRWNDFFVTASFARIGSIQCSRQLAADTHCGFGGYSSTARVDGFQITTLDVRDREFSSFFALIPVTAPPVK